MIALTPAAAESAVSFAHSKVEQVSVLLEVWMSQIRKGIVRMGMILLKLVNFVVGALF